MTTVTAATEKPVSKAEQARIDKREAIEQLRRMLKPGDTVYTVLRHVSASGTSRRIDLYTIQDNEPLFLSGYAGKVLGLKRSPKHDGLTVTGCGMDMGFHLVYELSSVLYQGDRGGYTLKHRWL